MRRQATIGTVCPTIKSNTRNNKRYILRVKYFQRKDTNKIEKNCVLHGLIYSTSLSLQETLAARLER
jgi:hypothetical protein